MKNAKTTSMTALLGIALTITVMIPSAYATHPNPSIMNYGQFDKTDSTQRIWYDTTSFNFVTVNGNENQGSLVEGYVDWARTQLDTGSDMTVTETTTWQSGDSLAQASFNASIYNYGWTTIIGDGTARYKIITFNTNDGLNYFTSGLCLTSSDTPIIGYIANHEMGHFAGLNHHPFVASSTHTAMMTGCNPGQGEIRTSDFTDINGWYT